MSPHYHKFYIPLKRTRKQIFKDLMRYRTTEDQGLTLKQIFYEVYSDVVEKHPADAVAADYHSHSQLLSYYFSFFFRFFI